MKINGFLKITSLDKDNNVVSIQEGSNTIMDTGRQNVMHGIYGVTDSAHPISRFILGIDGYNGGTAPASFLSSRVKTFSEGNGSEFYYIDFDVDSANGNVTVTDEEGTPAVNTVVTINQDNSTSTITYRFQIPQSNANGTGNRKYNEAALYCIGAPDGVDRIFSMRTFDIRTKDSTVSFDIEWIITFG